MLGGWGGPLATTNVHHPNVYLGCPEGCLLSLPLPLEQG